MEKSTVVFFELIDELIEDKELVLLIKDTQFATEIYSALCNTRWYKTRTGDSEIDIMNSLKGIYPGDCTYSWRTAGAHVAKIRNIHYGTKEDYMDFYCSGNEGSVDSKVEEIFNRLGWIRDTDY